jgi:hypothetical protein
MLYYLNNLKIGEEQIMPEQFKQVARTISKHQGEKDFKPKYAKLARKITDRVD